ncbi:MAG TPA: WbuC family cupin fold metalloprotein [Vicinamibacterales bacterium]|jgi:cupin fold WbuC family metalloprotein|nr:WbuC family cupin fold metalloprotein [Vicinamibacterales bacterium]
MHTKRESSEVLYAEDRIVTVDAAAIADLRLGATGNERRRIRLCAHRSVDDPLHEMLIVHVKDTYVRPHKHLGKSESFHVIEGEADVVMFDDEGAVTDVIQVGPVSSGRPFFYRIADPLFHTLLIRSDVLVFHETTAGPFRRSETVFAPWSPDDRKPDEIARFLSSLDEQLVSRSAARVGSAGE